MVAFFCSATFAVEATTDGCLCFAAGCLKARSTLFGRCTEASNPAAPKLDGGRRCEAVGPARSDVDVWGLLGLSFTLGVASDSESLCLSISTSESGSLLLSTMINGRSRRPLGGEGDGVSRR